MTLRRYVLEVIPTLELKTEERRKEEDEYLPIISRISTYVNINRTRRRRKIIISIAHITSLIIQNPPYRSSPNNSSFSSSFFFFSSSSSFFPTIIIIIIIYFYYLLHFTYLLNTTTHTYAVGTEACRTLPMPHRKRHCIKVRLKTATCF